MKELKDAGVLIARMGNLMDAEFGHNFLSNKEDPLQYGVAVYNKAQILQNHVHKERGRIPLHKTVEFVLVIAGRMRCNLYGVNKGLKLSYIMNPGDWVALHDGGHGFAVIDDKTKFIEVKSGPFVSTELDKERF